MFNIFKRKPSPPVFEITAVQPGSTVLMFPKEELSDEFAARLGELTAEQTKKSGVHFVVLSRQAFDVFVLPVSERL
ncbi:MAG: hypothetical protein V4669_13900 [Pseudomonadota bacterium]